MDTSVWSLAFRRGGPASDPAVGKLTQLFTEGPEPLLPGIVLQEILQGLPEASVARVRERLAAVDLAVPDRATHERAAALRRLGRERGLTLGTVDCLIAALALESGALLTTDRDFTLLADHVPLRLW